MVFSVRVYGLLLNERQEVLLTDEKENGFIYTKFPGGGVELGEGLLDALKREFMEECNTPIDIIGHVYTTENFVKSAFNDDQIVAIYYLVELVDTLNCELKTKPLDFAPSLDCQQVFRWVTLTSLKQEDLTFQLDQHVLSLLNSGQAWEGT